MMRIISTISFFLFATSVQAEWNPGILQPEDKYARALLCEEEYIDLQARVCQALKNSWCSQEKADLLMGLTLLTHPKVCVEVGVFIGSSFLPTAAVLQYLDSGTIYAVDAWSNQVATKNLKESDPNKPWWSIVDMDAVFDYFKWLVESWSLERYCTILRTTSEEAVELIPDGIDFLHLDGDYSEGGALRDVELYLPKVRSGGYILLSNFYLMVDREQPKVKAFCALCESCEIVATIENENSVLFQKN